MLCGFLCLNARNGGGDGGFARVIVGGLRLLILLRRFAGFGTGNCCLNGRFARVDRFLLNHHASLTGFAGFGAGYRRVAANEDGLMVWGKSGKSQFFPFEKLDHVLDGERIFVAMFADQGVTIPKDTFVRGNAEQFGTFLKARINKKLRIETKKKKMKAEKAAAEAKRGDKADKPQDNKGKRRKQKKSKKKR